MESFLISNACEVQVGRGLPDPILPPSPGRRRAAILTQSAVRDRAEEIANAIESSGTVSALIVELEDGEEAKSLQAIESVYHTLAEMELGRADTVVTVGGGAASDAGGFIAATWLRGVEVVHFPTTLLGAVDASIGGKTAVNLAGKNLVGAFWHPSRVFIDLNVLDQLPDEIKREGAAEAIKAGFIAAPRIVEAYESSGIAAPLDVVVPAAVKVKVDIVAEDFTERGRRALLNLGHTIGHGIEFASGISHGEAVAVGMVAAAAVSQHKLGFAGGDRLISVLQRTGLPVRAPAVDPAEVLKLVGLDKKRDAGGIRMVLLNSEGTVEVHRVEPADLLVGMRAVGL